MSPPELWMLLALTPDPMPIAVALSREICEGLVALLAQNGLPAACIRAGTGA